MSISVYSHEDCLKHDPGRGHAESPERLTVILDALRKSAIKDLLQFKEAPLGTDQQILLAHTPEHLHNIVTSVPENGYHSIDGDTVLSNGSLKAARRGVGAACQGITDLMDGSAETVFCATRPPGHHATYQQAVGFCLFNNAAIAALYAQLQYDLDRVAIVDFDVHHGNGSQAILPVKAGLFYISTHQSPLYPGTGLESENIDNKLLNIPLAANTGSEVYRSVFEETAIPALNKFKPELLIISAGFDAHVSDPLAGMALYEEDFHWLGSQLKELAIQHCNGRLLSVLEGGYNLEVLGDSVVAYLTGLESTNHTADV